MTMDRGRSRHSCFLSLLNDNVDYETAWGLAQDLYHGTRQIICAGWQPISDDGSLYPLGVNYHVEPEFKVFLFCLKRYESEVKMILYPAQLNFWRGYYDDDSKI